MKFQLMRSPDACENYCTRFRGEIPSDTSWGPCCVSPRRRERGIACAWLRGAPSRSYQASHRPLMPSVPLQQSQWPATRHSRIEASTCHQASMWRGDP